MHREGLNGICLDERGRDTGRGQVTGEGAGEKEGNCKNKFVACACLRMSMFVCGLDVVAGVGWLSSEPPKFRYSEDAGMIFFM